jgi:hypothetical protein
MAGDISSAYSKPTQKKRYASLLILNLAHWKAIHSSLRKLSAVYIPLVQVGINVS